MPSSPNAEKVVKPPKAALLGRGLGQIVAQKFAARARLSSQRAALARWLGRSSKKPTLSILK